MAITAIADGKDDVIIIQRTPGQEDRIIITRKELAKLAAKFPISKD